MLLRVCPRPRRRPPTRTPPTPPCAEERAANDALAKFIEGRAESLRGAPSAKAKELLTAATILDGGLARAWLALATCHWKDNDLDRAKDCLERAVAAADAAPEAFLAAQTAGEARRDLSMVLRAARGDPLEREANIVRSVAVAKEAVAKDLRNAGFWRT